MTTLETKGLGKKIMEQLSAINASKIEKRMEDEIQRCAEINEHISVLMDGVNVKTFIEKVSVLNIKNDIGFRLSTDTGAKCGIKLGLVKNNKHLLWTNEGFATALNGVIDKSIKRIDTQEIARDYGVDDVKEALSNALLIIYTGLAH